MVGSHNDPPSHLEELGEALRLAVEGVRRAPPPLDRQQRALDEVRRLAPPEPRPRLRPWMVLTVVAVVALGMVAYGLRDVRFSWTTPAPEGRIDSTEVDLRRQHRRPALIDVDVLPPRIEAISGRRADGGPYYLHACVRPTIPLRTRPGPFPAHAVFLFDPSNGQQPERFELRVKLLQTILESDPNIQYFNVLVLGSRPGLMMPASWLRNMREDRSGVVAKLAALPRPPFADLAEAWGPLAGLPILLPKHATLHAFLLAGDGLRCPEANPADLVDRWRAPGGRRTVFSCYCTTPGEETGRFLEALAGPDGGAYGCFRESDVAAAATAYKAESLRLDGVRFLPGPAARDVRLDGSRKRLYPGCVLRVGAQFEEMGRTTLVIEGALEGKKVIEEFPLEVREDDNSAPDVYNELPITAEP